MKITVRSFQKPVAITLSPKEIVFGVGSPFTVYRDVYKRQALGRVTKEDWQSRIKHAEKLQEDDADKECARADNLDKIVINLVDDSDMDSNYSDTECDNDDSASEVLATPLDDDADIADTLTAI